jgi:hypothetical protein
MYHKRQTLFISQIYKIIAIYLEKPKTAYRKLLYHKLHKFTPTNKQLKFVAMQKSVSSVAVFYSFIKAFSLSTERSSGA